MTLRKTAKAFPEDSTVRAELFQRAGQVLAPRRLVFRQGREPLLDYLPDRDRGEYLRDGSVGNGPLARRDRRLLVSEDRKGALRKVLGIAGEAHAVIVPAGLPRANTPVNESGCRVSTAAPAGSHDLSRERSLTHGNDNTRPRSGRRPRGGSRHGR